MSTNFFDVAKGITRGYASTLEDFPPRHPDEQNGWRKNWDVN